MNGTARLFIEIHTGKRTTLYCLKPLDPHPNVAVRAWRLWKPGVRKFYDVAICGRGWTSCTCPDAVYRHGGSSCKHILALQASGIL